MFLLHKAFEECKYIPGVVFLHKININYSYQNDSSYVYSTNISMHVDNEGQDG